MKRRDAVLLALGGIAAAAGLALQWSRHSETPPAIDPGLWSRRFVRPGGGELSMVEFAGRPLLINFWATWCAPCVREMPEVDRFASEFADKGWQVIGMAVDQENPVRDFLYRNPVHYPIALAGFDGVALSRMLGNESGGLPFTVAFSRSGVVIHRRIGETRFEELASWARELAKQP